jgi:mannose-1-phosphate guanylyltransferase/mannose-6-phosphate isomerase
MLFPVIISGGAGARLWPVSREAYPKPFIKLPDGQSLLGKTLARALRIEGASQVVTVTNKEYFFITKDEYFDSGARCEHVFILEPRARNTAPAIAMAALWAQAAHGDAAELLVLPADHLIGNVDRFLGAVRDARKLAGDGLLVTFGIKPTAPETAYGYIECGQPVRSRNGLRVARFVEKPAAAAASRMIASKKYLWNSGMFCFRAAAFLEALKACHPGLAKGAAECWAASRKDGEKIDLDEASFSRLPDISVDYAVMEKARNVAVVRAGFAWSDVGSWKALSELFPADRQGNRTQGDVVLADTRDSFIQSDARVVAAIGVERMIVVDTPDALLIAARDRAQDVKQVVQKLKVRDHAAHQVHRTVRRPWGTYTVLEEGPGYKIKRIVVKPRAALSLQMHRHRSEHWVVISGDARVANGEQELVVHPNQSTFIPAGNKHRLENPGATDLVIIEVQAGAYVGEDDIVRYDDIYGRK